MPKHFIPWFSVAVVLFLSALIAEAQQTKVFKLGELVFEGRSTLGRGRESFRRHLRQLGYIEGKNIIFESRSAQGKFERFPALAKELVDLKVDVLVASSTNEALTFKNATKTIPIVFFGGSDPVAAGLIDSLARPGGNLTGVTSISDVLAGKRLELLKETVPNLSRVAVLWNPQDKGSEHQWKESLHPARRLGLDLHSMEASSPAELEGAFKAIVKVRVSAIAVARGPLAAAHDKIIADLAAKYHLPTIYPREDFVESGGLISYGPHQDEPFVRAAVMIDKILKGTKPADIPVEQPTKFDLAINLKTAKTLGLTIPPIVLMRATRVIK